MPVFIHMLQRMSPEMAHRDILQRHAISVAKGDIADIGRRPSVAEGGAFDPKRATGGDEGCMSRFVQPAKTLEHDPDPDADLLATILRNQADLMVSSLPPTLVT